MITFEKYISSVKGKCIDYDGVAGVQCVDLIKHYCSVVLNIKLGSIGDAVNYWTGYAIQKVLYTNFTRIENTPKFIPKKGDIGIFSTKPYGHICLCTGEGDTTYFYSYDQNYNGKAVTKVKHSYKNFLGVLRPKPENTKVLDIDGYERGDELTGVYALKTLLMLAYYKKLQPVKLDSNNIFGAGTQKAVNYLLNKWGYFDNGIAGENFITRLYRELI